MDHELVLLQSLGFDVDVEHPHKIIVTSSCHLVAPKNVIQAAYFMATDLNIVTTFCVQYSPAAIACLCIFLASRYCKWPLPENKAGGTNWYSFAALTAEALISMSDTFWSVYKRTHPRLVKRTIFAKCHPAQDSQRFEQALKERAVADVPKKRQSSNPVNTETEGSVGSGNVDERRQSQVEKVNSVIRRAMLKNDIT
jgi:hypothetical protein